MSNVPFCAPTQIVLGRDAEKQTGALIKARQCQTVLLHYGGSSAQRSGLLDRLRAVLEEESVSFGRTAAPTAQVEIISMG